MSKRITTVFFDIDGVIFNRNQAEKEAVFSVLKTECNTLRNDYLDVWKKSNAIVWNECAVGKMTAEFAKYFRWQLLLKEYGIEISIDRAYTLSQQYYRLTSNKKYLVKDIQSVLKECQRQGLSMCIITNGFEDVQKNKLIQCGIESYFSEIITEKKTGYRKPDIRIFQSALDSMNVKASEAIYIGNSYEEDIIPAVQIGMRAIWFDCNRILSNFKHSEIFINVYLIDYALEILPIIFSIK